MKPARGRYIARDGDIRVDSIPASRRENTPAMKVIFRRKDGKWERVRAQDYHADVKEIAGLQRVGVRGSTLYWRKPS